MLSSKKYNYLLFIGAGIYFCTIVLYTYLSYFHSEKIPINNKFGDFDNIFLILISTLIIAPIIEEVVFRIIFLQNSVAKYIFFGGVAIFIIITKNYYILFLLLLFLIINIKLKNYRNVYSFILNALIFALIHYKLSDFSSFYSFVPVFFQFSLGLIFIWMIINYKLIVTIISHSIINALIILPVVMMLQFPDSKKNEIKNDETILQWEKTPIIGTSKIIYTNNSISAKRITIGNLLNLFEEKEPLIHDSLKLYRYNFEIKSKNNKNINKEELKKLLIESQLLQHEK